MYIVFPKDYLYHVEERNDLDISALSREEVNKDVRFIDYNRNIEEDIDNEYVENIIRRWESYS